MELSCCKHFAILLIVIATGLCLVAITTSHWSEYKQDRNTTDPLFTDYRGAVDAHKGLWKACYREKNSETICVSIVHELSYVAPVPMWWRVVQTTEVLSVVSSAIALMFWACCFACREDSSEKSAKCIKATTCFLCGFAAIYQCIAVSLWIIKEKQLSSHVDYHYGWSVWVAAAAGCVDLLAVVIAFISQPSILYTEAMRFER